MNKNIKQIISIILMLMGTVIIFIAYWNNDSLTNIQFLKQEWLSLLIGATVSFMGVQIHFSIEEEKRKERLKRRNEKEDSLLYNKVMNELKVYFQDKDYWYSGFISEVAVEECTDDKGNDLIKVTFTTTMPGIITGPQGEDISRIEMFLYRKLEKFIEIHINENTLWRR